MQSLSCVIPKPCFEFVAVPKRRLRVVSAVACPMKTTAASAATMYELLSVAETAGPEEIKAAYRRQARRWHPDACRDAGEKGYFAERFMRAREAYEVLSDPALRRDYDLGLLRADGWASAVGGGVVFRKGGGGAAARAARERGFGDWESQMEGLRTRRSGAREAGRRWAAGEESWGSRMRRAHGFEPSDCYVS